MSMQNVWNEKFTATRADDYHMVNQVHLKKGAHTVHLRGLDRYRGKPTIAIIFATWCSSCNDAYPFFKQLYARYHAKGLEILGVAYDLAEDEKANLAELDRFRAKHDIPWELRQVPCTPETWAKAMPPELEGWDGLPIILTVRADGTVQHVFGGWFGPATGAEGERLRAWFEEATQELVEAPRP
jgi:thiol-disulfide isomerase/thioredoxin